MVEEGVASVSNPQVGMSRAQAGGERCINQVVLLAWNSMFLADRSIREAKKTTRAK
jgi:hypothetical protein